MSRQVGDDRSRPGYPPVTSHLSPSERKKRKPISCRRCRAHKKRCDRQDPCKQCASAGQACQYEAATAHLRSKYAKSAPSSASKPQRWPSDVGDEARVIALVSNTTFTSHLLRLWLDKLDYLYDSVRDTQIHVDLVSGWPEAGSLEKYRPLLAIVTAICAQLMPNDLEVCFQLAGAAPGTSTPASLSLTPPSTSTTPSPLHGEVRVKDWQEPCARYAIRACDRYLDHYTRAHGAIALEYVQASLQCVSYLKNCGMVTAVRNRLARDMSTLQIANIHMLDHPSKAGQWYTEARQRHTARRLFWSYFQYDRFTIMLMNDLGITLLNAKQCHVWLCDQDGRVKHISDLNCPTDRSYTLPPRPRVVAVQDQPGLSAHNTISPMSRFSSAMAQAAAIGGQLTETVSSISFNAWSGNEDMIETTKQTLAYRTETTRLDAAIADLQSNYLEGQFDARTGRESHWPTSPERWQSCVLAITLTKLRADAAIALAHALPPHLLDYNWLNTKCVTMYAHLLRHGLALPRSLAVGSLGWSFYLFYLAQPIKELQSRVRAQLDAVHANHIDPLADDAETKQPERVQTDEVLRLVVQGRNLLCQIAQESDVTLAAHLADDVCSHWRTGGGQGSAVTSTAQYARLADPRLISADVEQSVCIWRKCLEDASSHTTTMESIAPQLDVSPWLELLESHKSLLASMTDAIGSR